MKVLKFFVKLLLKLIVKIFFSGVEVMGKENIPKEGPIIFVGNHQNQFLDPVLLTTSIDLPVGFIVAKKSYDMSLIGDFAKMMNAIPVQRPQDISKRGVGLLVSYEDGILTGEDTQFKSQVNLNDSIVIEGSSNQPQVIEIISDTQLKLKIPFDFPITKKTKFKVYPYIDHKDVYKTVWERLIEKKNIGIFPEGGSHDRPHLLPLKAGVTLMALGAMSKDPNCKITIVPCGLNYFQGHRFRSHVLVQYGCPIVIPQELVSLYQTNKRDACGKLLALIEEGLLNVTVNYPTYQVMQIAQLTRKLYQPDNKDLPAEEFLRLQQRMIKGFLQMQDNPKVKELVENVTEYHKKLRKYGLNDQQVKSVQNTSVWLIIPRMIYFVLLFLISFPGNVLLFPIAAIARPFAQKKAKISLQSSTVKIRGNDVIASYKVITGLVLTPLFMLLYTLIWTIIFGLKSGFMFALFLPICSYASIKIMEEEFNVWNSTIPLAKHLLKKDFRVICKGIKETRDRLKRQVREVVEELGPKMGEEFWKDRVITKDELIDEKESANNSIFKYKRRIYHVREIDDNYNIIQGLEEIF